MKTRQAIRRVPFKAAVPLDIEVMTIAQLWAMAPPGYLSSPQRPTFHLLVLVTSGSTTHTLDFAEHHLAKGAMLWVRPGQVQVFGEQATGDLVLFQPGFLIPGTHAATLADDRAGPVEATVPFEATRRALRREYTRAAGFGQPTVGQAETLRHLLSLLILEMARHAPDPGRPDPTGLDARFRDLLERDFAAAHDVEHYAQRLGYSARTLNRATQAAAGESPKQAVNRRLVLEARRLLAHTDQPVARLARRLGFRDPSNFSTFFIVHTGQSPTAFRATTRPAGGI
ncbi:AraC family transcriptional regulator [Amycolatopsis sp. NPDC004079]|uniref:helix-turn-helix domain-containing protein n=1 Tax=Amycolatopsis sp. NPDC004079 TaxID=3154549 RepID=UPI0033BB43D9